MPLACRLMLTIPPSSNELYANAKLPSRGRFKTKKYREWIEAAGWQLQAQPRAAFSGPFRIRVLVNDKMRGDVGNREKAATDLLVAHRVVPDDRFAQSVSVERSADVEPGRCILIVESAE